MPNFTKDAKIGFNIGWDYYSYDMNIPNYLLTNKDVKPILDGFNEARSRKVKQIQTDRFVKKWLLLRVNAWRRNRHFDDSVTPDFIKIIDATHCPVTGDRLTHSTEYYTNWSVDRVNNDASYAIGNIIVVSSRANIAKGNYTHQQIINFAYNENANIPKYADKRNKELQPLSRIEWARWALICSHAPIAESDEGHLKMSYVSPCVISPPPGLCGRNFSFLQMFISRKIDGTDCGEYKKILESIVKHKRKTLNSIVKKGEKIYVRNSLEIWFDVSLFSMFIDFYETLSDDEKHRIYCITMRIWGSHTQKILDADYHFQTKGYLENIKKSDNLPEVAKLAAA
jgi:hypothetical protein